MTNSHMVTCVHAMGGDKVLPTKKVIVKKKLAPDEVTSEKFLEFEEIEDVGEGRVKLVDYDKLVAELDGRMLSIRGIGELMKKCSGGLKSKVYYSEVLGALKRLRDEGRIEFKRRRGEVIYYQITKVEENVK